MALIITLALLVAVVTGLAVYVVAIVRDELAVELQRRRLQAEVARATARLRRLEHESLRQMHSVIQSDDEEAS